MEPSPSVDDSSFAGPISPLAQFPEPGTAGYRMLRNWIGRVWSQLDEGDRLILWLADVERLSHRRVADMVDRPEDEVRTRHYRARLALSEAAARALNRRATEEGSGR